MNNPRCDSSLMHTPKFGNWGIARKCRPTCPHDFEAKIWPQPIIVPQTWFMQLYKGIHTVFVTEKWTDRVMKSDRTMRAPDTAPHMNQRIWNTLPANCGPMRGGLSIRPALLLTSPQQVLVYAKEDPQECSQGAILKRRCSEYGQATSNGRDTEYSADNHSHSTTRGCKHMHCHQRVQSPGNNALSNWSRHM